MKFKQMINPHSHSDGSLDGASSVSSIIKRNMELGAKYVSMTEHGNLNTAMDLYHSCKKLGAKPIMGIELYLEPPFKEELEKSYRQAFKDDKNPDKKVHDAITKYYTHLTVHFKNEAAYQHFCLLSPKMNERAIVKGGEAKPICTLDELAQAAGNITICSSCLIGAVQKWLLPDRITGEIRPDLSEKSYLLLREIAGKDSFFVEIFPHKVTHNWVSPKKNKDTGLIITEGWYKPNECTPWFPDGDMQRKANQFVLDLAKKHNDPVIISLDSHFAVPEDKMVQDCVEQGTLIVTSDGVKKIEDIRPGDEVLTHSGRFQKVLSTRGTYSQKRKVKLSFGDKHGLIVTEDHLLYKPNVYVKDTRKNGTRTTTRTISDFSWESASEINNQDYLWFPSIVSHKKITNLSSYFDMIPFIKPNCGNMVKSALPISKIDIDEDFCYFLGLFLGDGHAGGKDASIVVNFWNKSGLEKLHRFFSKNSLPYRTVSNEKGEIFIIHINQPQFKRFLVNFLYKDKQKFISTSWFFSLKEDYQNRIIEGLYHADGRSKGPSLSILTVSIHLYGLLIHWALKNKLMFSNDFIPPKGQTSRLLSSQEAYGVRFIGSTKDRVIKMLNLSKTPNDHNYSKFGFVAEGGFTKQIKKKEEVNTDLPVYDIEVENDSSFVTIWGTVHNCKLGNGKEAWRFHNSYHIYTTDESAITLQETLGVSDRDIEEYVDNSYKFASLFDNFNIKTSNERWVLTPLPENWQIELKRKIDYYGRMDWTNSEMIQRLKLEIDTLAHNGTINLMPYFFTVENIAEFCKREGILMNLRGSAAGSLLFYVIGASAVNPLKHDLSFGRFLTLGRIRAKDLPDADMDVSDKDRVMEYLESKYGDAFCKISIDTMLKLKSSIKDSERAIKGEVSKATEDLCKKLPMFPQGSDDRDLTMGYEDDSGKHPGLIDTHADLKAWIVDNPEVWASAAAMLGIHRQKGVHPCGVIIADRPVQSYVPLISISGNKATGFSPKAVTMAGLVKYDVLGVNTLKDIELTVKSIKNRLGIDLDPWNLPYDQKVMAAFGEGRTSSVFQFDTATVVPYLKEICPSNIDDLAVITALCRPGTLDAPSGDGRTLAQVFVARANGEQIEYVHPDMEEILKDTMGIPLFQEQTIKMFRVLAGYSEEKAETARRAIGKKQQEVLEACVNDLKTSCLARGWQMSQVLLLAEQIMASAKYSFNKSHAISYAYVAYACMYFKEKYSIDWWNASLCNAAKSEIATKFWKHTKKWILLPDINKSAANFIIEGDKIRAPLSMITGVGEKAYSQLTEKGPYTDIKSFVNIFCNKFEDGERSAVHSGIIYKLIGAGVLDSLFDQKDLATVEKFEIFERLKAEIKKKKQKPIKPEFIGMSDLGDYLVKKELMPIYSEDLRTIMLPHRKGFPGNHGEWLVGRAGAELKVVDGDQINNFMTSDTANGERCCIGYVIDESIISYKNKTRQATKMQVDVGGTFFETVFWPDFNDESGVAPSGFKGLPVMMRFYNKYGKCSLKAVIPLIKKEQLETYNVL